MEILFRFLIGGTVVSLFAALGDMFKPKSFGGLFAAAPSVALATLGLAVIKEGPHYAAVESRSMIAGAIAFLAYAICVTQFVMRSHARALTVTIAVIPIWFAIAFALQRFLT